MKVVVVGGVAGGASAAARMRRLDENAEIVVLEKGKHVSFSNCCLPYYLSGTIEKSSSLVLMNPEKFKNLHNIETRTNHEVLKINRQAHNIVVKDVTTGEVYEEGYDKLILSPGAAPIRPQTISGVNGKNVFTVRNVVDIENLKNFLDENQCDNVAVIGGGFIGIECVENLRESGKQVTLVEAADQIMMPFDYDMVQALHKEMLDHDVKMYLSSMVTAIDEHSVMFTCNDQAQRIDADAVVLTIGVAPETVLAVDAGLEIGETRGIKVNEYFQTSDEDIYAVGDAIEICNWITGTPGRLALAGPAQRQARAAVNHICNIKDKKDSFHYIGSSCVRLFDKNAACTGLNEKTVKKTGIPYDFAYVLPADKVGLMPGSQYMNFKLIFEKSTGKILGAQAIGKGEVVQRIDVIATLISMGGTLDDLKEMELCYAPVFDTAKDVVNMAALVGLNILEERIRQVPVTKVRELVEAGAFIIDVREESEFNAGHLKNALNIPQSQFRQRVNEIPRDIPVYLHCRTSQRSYYTLMALQGMGYKNVINISGSFLGISLFEYYNDSTTGREPIVTAYNFN